MTYTCGPYGNFQGGETGGKYDLVVSTCGWNRSWTPSSLDPCVATSCQVRLSDMTDQLSKSKPPTGAISFFSMCFYFIIIG